MTHLLYHDLSSATGDSSPFDKAVLQICETGAVGIVSPYIGVSYLQRVISASGTWRLVSDIEAWLASLSMRARPKAWQFIRENLGHIHHCSAIHAKAVIGEELAMLGSANLTNAGMLGRTEMGIQIDDPKMVRELNEWFEALWLQTHSPIVDETNSFVRWLDEEAERSSAKRAKFSLSNSGITVRASLVRLSAPKTLGPKATEAIHLDDVARDLIAQEHVHYATLREALESAIDSLAEQGFVFSQIVDSIRLSFPAASIREVYFSLVQHCANHVRSVFSENTQNRLILTNGRFTQSSKDLIFIALERFDLFLSILVSHLNFDRAQNPPDEDALIALTGFAGHHQVILIADLLESGFLEFDDVPGHLPRYCLSNTFEWSSRYKLFRTALQAWNRRKNETIANPIKPQLGNTRYQVDDEVSDAFLSDSPTESQLIERVSLSDYLRSEREREVATTKKRDEQLEIQRQKHRNGIDRILAHILLSLTSGQSSPLAKDLLSDLPMRLDVDAKWVQQVLDSKVPDLPHALLTKKNLVSIDPHLDWKDLENYPLAQGVCKSFLGL
jgi:hypothetical protein